MNDVCPLLLSRPEKEVGVLGSSILLEVSDDAGQSIVLRNWLLDVIAVIGQPFEPIVRCLEYEPCGSAFVEKQLIHGFQSL